MWLTESLISHTKINEFRTDKVLWWWLPWTWRVCSDNVFKLQNVSAVDGLHLLYTVAILPVVYTVLWFLGVYDQDAPEELLLALPSLYRQGRLGLVYKPHSFWITMADSLYQSIVIFFLSEGVSFLLLLHQLFCIYSMMYHIIPVCGQGQFSLDISHSDSCCVLVDLVGLHYFVIVSVLFQRRSIVSLIILWLGKWYTYEGQHCIPIICKNRALCFATW